MSIRQPTVGGGDEYEADSRAGPLYQTIRLSIRDDIARGVHTAGDRLPSESELAKTFGTTRTTVRQALSRLVFEGLIVRHNGRGSFVADNPVIHSTIDSRDCLTFEEQMALSGRSVTYGSCSFTQVPAPPEVTASLRLAPGADVFRMERLRIIEGRAVCLEARYMPREVGLRVTGAMLAYQPAHRFVSDILGRTMPTIVVSITAEVAGDELALKLDVPTGSAVLVRANRHHADDGTPILCGRSVFPGDVCTDYVLGRKLSDSGSQAAASPSSKSN